MQVIGISIVEKLFITFLYSTKNFIPSIQFLVLFTIHHTPDTQTKINCPILFIFPFIFSLYSAYYISAIKLDLQLPSFSLSLLPTQNLQTNTKATQIHFLCLLFSGVRATQ